MNDTWACTNCGYNYNHNSHCITAGCKKPRSPEPGVNTLAKKSETDDLAGKLLKLPRYSPSFGETESLGQLYATMDNDDKGKWVRRDQVVALLRKPRKS
jgi:predicted  nucleic acid-binding Zn-ribbon protein